MITGLTKNGRNSVMRAVEIRRTREELAGGHGFGAGLHLTKELVFDLGPPLGHLILLLLTRMALLLSLQV